MKVNKPILYVVHCIDTEGPLVEDMDATFDRLESIFGIRLPATQENLAAIQKMEMNLGGQQEAVAKCFSPSLLKYNTSWSDIESMLDILLSSQFRTSDLDDFGNGWIYSWHCMDHVGYADNLRHKDIGYGNVFKFYLSKLNSSKSLDDEMNWHFHPLSLERGSIQAATSYLNSYDLLTQILCRRILDYAWFPAVNRPGFHSERPDSHAFLEQWIPFDYANQVCEDEQDQPDIYNGRFGDWRRAPTSWRGYHPSHDDYQLTGNCRRLIFRCLNVGTRMRSLTKEHVNQALSEAKLSGASILAFADHDYRNIVPDVNYVRGILNEARVSFPDVLIKYSGAQEAAIGLMGYGGKKSPKLALSLSGNHLTVDVEEGEIFGPQPFLAIKTREGRYYHDNFDVIEPNKKWSYIFDNQTIEISNISKVGVGTAGKYGNTCVKVMSF